MRAHIPSYELKAPAKLEEVLALLASGEWQPFAGGTDLMVLAEAGKLPQRRFVGLWRLAELRGIEETPQHLTLGALTTYTQVQRHATLQREFPLLCQAARETGGIATQNRGTLAGNIANASPAADSPPALLVYEAELEVVSSRGARWVPYLGFHTGYKKMNLAPGEIIRRIRLPRNDWATREGTALAVPKAAPSAVGALAPEGRRELISYYRKVGTRKAQAISKVCFAGIAVFDGNTVRDVRIALGSVAPVPLRCSSTEAVLRGQPLTPALVAAAQEALAEEISPIDDFRSTAHYRRCVGRNLVAAFLETRTKNG